MNLINKCDSRLERCHEHLENIGRREVAQDIGIVLDDLYRLRHHYDLLLQQHDGDDCHSCAASGEAEQTENNSQIDLPSML